MAEKNTFSNSPFIIGIGASAGGLEALQQFFQHMPGNSGLSFVVVQHLSPDYKGNAGGEWDAGRTQYGVSDSAEEAYDD